MKRKIAISSIVLFTLIVIAAVMHIRHIEEDESGSGSRPSSHSSVHSSVEFYPGNEYNTSFGHEGDILEGYSYQFVIDCEVEEGALLLRVFDMNGYDISGGVYTEEMKAEMMAKFTLVWKERIDTSGEHVYDLDLPVGSYYFNLGAEDEQTVADASYTLIETRDD